MHSIQTENSSGQTSTPSTVLYSVLSWHLLYCILYCLDIYKITFILHTSLFILHKLSDTPISLNQRVFWCCVKVGFVHTDLFLAKMISSVSQELSPKGPLTPDTQLPKK